MCVLSFTRNIVAKAIIIYHSEELVCVSVNIRELIVGNLVDLVDQLLIYIYRQNDQNQSICTDLQNGAGPFEWVAPCEDDVDVIPFAYSDPST